MGLWQYAFGRRSGVLPLTIGQYQLGLINYPLKNEFTFVVHLIDDHVSARAE